MTKYLAAAAIAFAAFAYTAPANAAQCVAVNQWGQSFVGRHSYNYNAAQRSAFNRCNYYSHGAGCRIVNCRG